jgi:dihydrofolate reductase
MSRLALVVARAANNVIGAAGTIPWRIPDDRRHFRNVTTGKPCIMGRKTWESLPRKPLPGRLNIVVSRNPNYAAAGALVAETFDSALALAQVERSDEISVIGGAEIYRAALPLADRIYLTEIEAAFEGDTYFPHLEETAWFEDAREENVTADGVKYAFVTLRRRSAFDETAYQ